MATIAPSEHGKDCSHLLPFSAQMIFNAVIILQVPLQLHCMQESTDSSPVPAEQMDPSYFCAGSVGRY